MTVVVRLFRVVFDVLTKDGLCILRQKNENVLRQVIQDSV